MHLLSMRRWHRWLGLGLGWLMLAWFISGGVMMYAHLPRELKTAQGRLATAPPLDTSQVNLGFAGAWRRAGVSQPPAEARLTTLNGRPAFHFYTAGHGWRIVWADTGELMEQASLGLARASARQALAKEAKLAYLGLVERDQWTVGTGTQAGTGPFHKFAAGDGLGSEIYVSSVTGEACQLTTSSKRFWSWMGAIPHWLYFTVLRQHLELWRWTIIVLSAVGCLLCLSGLWIGIRFFKWSGYGRDRHRRKSAFVGLRKWHHYLGLLFGIPALAWTFSGLLSMNPFGWGTPPPYVMGVAHRLAGECLGPNACRIPPQQAATLLPKNFTLKMLSLKSFQGEPFYLALDGRGVSRLIPASRQPARALAALSAAELTRAAQRLLPGHAMKSAKLLARGDLYLPRRTTPVFKAIYADPGETWLYLDPARVRVIRSLDSKGRLNRWLYHFLHCLDLPWLLEHWLVREALMLFLLAGGTLLCFLGPWSWLARRRNQRRRP